MTIAHFLLSVATFREAPMSGHTDPDPTVHSVNQWLDTVAGPESRFIVDHRLSGLARWQNDSISNKLSKCYDSYLN